MKALAITYRPKHFKDITEQDNIKLILGQQLETEKTLNAYLFVGAAGTGKTTSARIFANDINKGKGMPKEIDAASNSGVENVRELIEDAKNRAILSDFKTFIIDECHMLSQAAWASFLKLLEEPPAGAVFIFCTTDPQKIPDTILSRVQRYDFQRISQDGIVERLKYILFMEQANEAQKEEFLTSRVYLDGPPEEIEALEFIAKIADGGMRDAITLMDKCLSFSPTLDIKNVTDALGISGYDEMIDLLNYLLPKSKDKAKAIEVIEKMHNSGKDLKQFMKQFLAFILDVIKYQFYQDFKHIKIPQSYKSNLDALKEEDLHPILKTILMLQNKIKYENNAKVLIEAEILVTIDNIGTEVKDGN